MVSAGPMAVESFNLSFPLCVSGAGGFSMVDVFWFSFWM